MHRDILTVKNRWMASMPNRAQINSVYFDVEYKSVRWCDRVKLTLEREAPAFRLSSVELWKGRKLREHADQLHELVSNLVEDKRADGLSVVDVAVITDFLFCYCRE